MGSTGYLRQKMESAKARYVTHETKHFIYFYLGQVAILLFKSG